MSDDIQQLLDFGTVSVFYVVWNRSGNLYYMQQVSPDAMEMQWTKKRHRGTCFYTEDEARACARTANKVGRKGVSMIMANIDVVEEFDYRDWP